MNKPQKPKDKKRNIYKVAGIAFMFTMLPLSADAKADNENILRISLNIIS